MPNIYVDRALKQVIRDRQEAIASQNDDVDEEEVSEREALLTMCDEKFQERYEAKGGDSLNDTWA